MNTPAIRALIVLLLAAAAGAGCNTEAENPFTAANRTTTPPAESDLVFTSDGYAPRAGSPRDIYSAQDTGVGVARHTFCNDETRRCDTVEAAPAPDRRRLAVRKILRDTNNDGRLGPEDGEALLMVDLSRGVEGELFPQAAQLSGVDWSPREDILVYSGVGEGGLEDLFRTVPRPDPEESFNLTVSADVRERRPRIDPSGTVAAYERIEADGKGQIWVFGSRAAQSRITSGGPGTEALAGTPYVVGGDADPDFSPDGRFLVFRRLTATGNGGRGSWDVMTVRTDGSSLTTIVSGPAYRGAPDWGDRGIVFEEVDVAAGQSRLVVVQPDGSGRRVVVTAGSGRLLTYPRWLP
jgi:hypothetical protein